MKRSYLCTAASAAGLTFTLPLQAFGQAQPAPPALSSTQNAQASDTAEEVIVTGTRQQGRTKEESPAPVDVISAAELQRSGREDVFEALNTILPSLDVPAVGEDTSNLVRAARLRGLSPDDVLVLVDGKRRHVSANLNEDTGPNEGSDPVDLDTIPISLVDHIEVLRDGAAAQYGSDAIAGVINIILKHANRGGDAFAQEGATYVGDGFTNSLGSNQGFALGQNGFFDLAEDYRYHDRTNRSGNFPPNTGPIYIPRTTNELEGDPRYNLVNIGYNAGYDLGAAELYSFATYTYRHADALANFRNPNTGRGGYPSAAVYYPNGYEPIENLNEDDYSVTGGIKGEVFNGYHYDLSSTYGGDIDNIGVQDTFNPSYYSTFGYSPLHVHAGEFNSTEWTNNLDLSKPYELSFLAKPLNVAVGAEFRRDTYAIQPGDPASRYGGGSQGYSGFTLQDSNSFHRENEAVYGDVATSPIDKLQVDLAGRFEHYSDFGNTESGKATARYDFSKFLGVRGTISNGFRAPSLAQEGYSGVNVSPVQASGQFPVDSPGAAILGAQKLKAERSQNYSAGIVSEPVEHMHIALDVYQIDIRDQIVNSGLISNSNIIAAYNLDGFGIPAGVTPAETTAQFYTNGVNTRNQGVDLTIDYKTFLNDGGKIDWLLAGNANSTVFTRINPAAQLTPDVLSEIKEATPKSKFLLQAVYTKDPWSVVLRETRYGQVIEVYPTPGGGPPYSANRNRPTFITDIALGYKITRNVTFTIGANNLFDRYANHTTAASRYQNGIDYIEASPYGIDGGTYYARLSIGWGGSPATRQESSSALPPLAAPAQSPVRTYLVFFDWDRADLTARARQIVSTAAEASSHVQTTVIEVNGYTDLSGSPVYNQKLSVRRAQSVKTELVKDGVPEQEVNIHGYGESSPLVQTAVGVREPQNRRVEIVLK